jgi:hypothetical protein
MEKSPLYEYSIKSQALVGKIGSHRVIKLIIWQAHEQVFHSGIDSTHFKLKEKYYLIDARKSINTALKDCYVCRKFTATTYEPQCAQLPRERLTAERPFSAIGIDLTGHMYVRRGEETVKNYCLIATCLWSRYTHLELVQDCTAESVAAALERVLARRGIPGKIFCDGAKYFVKISNEMKQIWKSVNVEKVKQKVGKGISWHFTAPKAAWEGATYERLIAIVKKALKVTLRRYESLTDWELSNLLCRIEAYMND